jgi:hypothetical protein
VAISLGHVQPRSQGREGKRFYVKLRMSARLGSLRVTPFVAAEADVRKLGHDKEAFEFPTSDWSSYDPMGEGLGGVE